MRFNILESVRSNMMHALQRLNERSKTLLQILVSQLHDQADKENTEKECTKTCYLLTLPTELLLNITSYLPVLPEACLALTCKRLSTIYHSTLLSESLDFNQEFTPSLHHYQNSYNFITPRWQFINLLEDSRWKACSKCLKLHRTTSFSTRELKRKSEDRTCNLGDAAGIVDLCPCIKLTYNDKMELIELLERRKEPIAALVTLFGSHVSGSFSWHGCTKTYGSTQLKIEIFPELDENNQLNIKTKYLLSVDLEKLGEIEHLTPRLGCAHRSVDLWLASVCQRTHQYCDGSCTSCKQIAICGICNTWLRCPRKGPCRMDKESGKAIYSFLTERCLGGISSIPDQAWAAQRIHPAENGNKKTVRSVHGSFAFGFLF